MTTDAALDLLVQRAAWEARGVLGLDLVHPDGEELPPWQPGAHIDLTLPSGIIRQYSLCGVRREPPAGALHVERFAATGVGPGDDAEDGAFEVELRQSGITLTVPADTSVLHTVLEHLPNLNYSCEEGYCGTCETRVLAGTPLHRDTVLSEAERETGDTMMICVSRSKTPLLTLDL